MISIFRFVILCLAFNLFRSAFCGIPPSSVASQPKDQGSTVNNKPAISKGDTAEPLPLLGGHKTPLHVLINRKKRYYKQKEERKKILAQPGNSTQKQAVIAQIEHEKAVRRDANHKRYLRLQFSVLTGSAFPAEQRMWDTKLRTKAYRTSDPKLEERYQKELQSKRDKNKAKKDEKLASTQIQETSQTTLLRKRGEPRSFDLNVELEEHSGEEVQSKSPVQHTQAVPPKIDRSKGKYYKPVHTLTKKERSEMNAKKRARYKHRMGIWKEALQDTSKMTPELQKQIEKHQKTNRASSRKYVNKLIDLSAKGQISKKQAMTLGKYSSSKEWRESSPTNMKFYQEKYKKDYERKKGKALKTERENISQSTSSLQKRGEPKSFDLNDQLEEHEGEEVQSQPSQVPSVQHVQEVPQLKQNQSRGKRYIPVSELSEEKRQEINAKERARYKQRKELWKEALLDPSKMTPKIKKRMESSKRSNKAATSKYVKKLKSLSSQGLATEKQENTIGLYNRNKRWREASPTNMKRYRDKNKKDYIRKKTKRNKKQDNQETNSHK